jgi:hypothetical protein
VGDRFIHKILGCLSKYTHVSDENVIFNTFPLISFTVIRDHFTKDSNFMIMDVTGEVTDITLVRGDIITNTVTIPTGRNFIIRQIAKDFNISTEIAESTLRLYLSKKLTDETGGKMSEIMASVESEWAIYIENALTELAPDMNLPSKMFITADNDVSEMYMDFLSIPKTDTTNIFRRNLKLEQINLEKTSTFYTNDSGFILDEFVVMLALFYKKMFI